MSSSSGLPYGENPKIRDENRRLQAKYDLAARFYDLLDYPWERQYRHWRPQLLGDVGGRVLEAGVGTGRNIPHYGSDVDLVGVDLSRSMLARAWRRSIKANREVDLRQDDVTVMDSVATADFDWVVSFFLCCVMPDALQPQALSQFARVLKPGGRFRLLEMVYSETPRYRRMQNLFAPFVEKIYGARFDRGTLAHVEGHDELSITRTYFVKRDVYQIIEGVRHD